jgi:hypothetical protein
MRLVIVALLVLSAGCPAKLAARSEDDGAGMGSGGAGAPSECDVASDCVAAGPRCCDCPTHAVPATDPAQRACDEVDCEPMSCGSPLEPACEGGRCVLACSPVACDGASCAYGFVTDVNGCLTCECAAPPAMECGLDADCARVREDCCGCAMGGEDTAILASEVALHDASLGCPTTPACPGFDTCAPDLAARCVQGMCALVSGAPPADACGRADLPACPVSQVCTVNADEQATMYGVGVCR